MLVQSRSPMTMMMMIMDLNGSMLMLAMLLNFVVASHSEAQWHLVWSDEFDGAALNTSVWNVKANESHCCSPLPGVLKGELELYVPDEVGVQNGYLWLRTRKRQIMGPKGQLYNYTSGWVDTKNKYFHKFGRFEANCSLPTTAAEGIWPAFWLMPQNGTCWPTGGEIDIFEMNGNTFEDAVWGSYHWAKPGECGKDREVIPGAPWRPHDSNKDWQMDWHIYAVEWYPDRLDFYVDGNKYLTRYSDKVLLPKDPMFIIFDQAVDGWLNPPKSTGPYAQGVLLKVDYVRVYKSSNATH